jgi:hypothetical protein
MEEDAEKLCVTEQFLKSHKMEQALVAKDYLSHLLIKNLTLKLELFIT